MVANHERAYTPQEINSAMPKITLVRRAYSPSGGAEKYLLRLASNLAESGWEAELVTAANWPSDTWKWGKIHRIPGDSPMAFAHAFRELRKTEALGITFSLERVWEADFYRAGDGVHKAWLQRLAKHSSALSNAIRRIKQKHREIVALETSLYAPPSQTKIIANSQLVADEITQLYATEPKRIRVIHNGYNAPLPSPNQAQKIRQTKRAELGLRDGDVAVLFVGSGWKRKGAYTCIDAMSYLDAKNVKLIIAGKGKPPLHLPENVSLLGEVKDVPALYQAADLFLLPTLYDPFSNATLEAACFGLPVITSSENGFSEALLRHGGGSILQCPSDPKEIADTIQSWLDPEYRKEAQIKLRTLAQHHTESTNLEQTLDFILQT